MDTFKSLRPSLLRCCERAGHQGRIQLARGDRGAVTADLVIAIPLLLLLPLAIVQFALWSHATHVAQVAASHGLAAARAQNGTAAAGTASAQRMLDQLARGPLTGPRVTSDRTATSATVRISGTATSVLPFLTLPVYAEATGPVERFVPTTLGFTDLDATTACTTEAASAAGEQNVRNRCVDILRIPLEEAPA